MDEHDQVTDKRRLKRHELTGAVNVYDSLSKSFLGRLVNVHDEGVMVMGHYPFDEGKIYQLDLFLPEALDGHDSIAMGVDCLWTRAEDDERLYWAGCKIIDISDEARHRLQTLVQLFGD